MTPLELVVGEIQVERHAPDVRRAPAAAGTILAQTKCVYHKASLGGKLGAETIVSSIPGVTVPIIEQLARGIVNRKLLISSCRWIASPLR